MCLNTTHNHLPITVSYFTKPLTIVDDWSIGRIHITWYCHPLLYLAMIYGIDELSGAFVWNIYSGWCPPPLPLEYLSKTYHYV